MIPERRHIQNLGEECGLTDLRDQPSNGIKTLGRINSPNPQKTRI